MAERALLRIGGASAIVGAILGVAVNALFPRQADPTRIDEFLQRVADAPTWQGVQVGLLVSVLLTLGGLAALYRSIGGGAGAAWARLGFGAALLGGGVFLVNVGVGGWAVGESAASWAGAGEPEKAVAFRVAEAFFHLYTGSFSVSAIVLFGVAPLLYGLAVALSDAYPRWLGWVAVLDGITGVLTGLLLFYNGPSALTVNILFPAVAVAFTILVFIWGVLMWRKAGAAA